MGVKRYLVYDVAGQRRGRLANPFTIKRQGWQKRKRFRGLNLIEISAKKNL